MPYRSSDTFYFSKAITGAATPVEVLALNRDRSWINCIITGTDYYYLFAKTVPVGTTDMILVDGNNPMIFSGDNIPTGTLWIYSATTQTIHGAYCNA